VERCYHHCTTRTLWTTAPKIEGMVANQAFTAWFSALAQGKKQLPKMLWQSGSLPCRTCGCPNATLCPNFPSCKSDDDVSAWPLVFGEASGGGPRATTLLLDVRVYGAVADNATDCTSAIEAALAAAAAAVVPATVVLPGPGIYVSGPLLLNNSVRLTLRIEADATLASAGIELAELGRWPIISDLYPANVHPPGAGRPGVYSPILHLLNCTDLIIEGGGTLDGRGQGGWWQSVTYAVRIKSPNASCPNPKCRGCQGSCPSRPRLFLTENSRFISLTNVTFKNSPFWTTHFYNSSDVHISGLRVENPAGGPNASSPIAFVQKYGYGPNADGIDVEHTQRVLIENCNIRCGDDAICLKAGFTRSALPPTLDVLARRNRIHSSCPHIPGLNVPPTANANDGCGGMKFGYGTHSGIANVLFEDTQVDFAGVAIKLSSHLGEGGPLRNITFKGTTITKAGIAVNVNLGTTPKTNLSQLSSLDGLSIVDLSAEDSIGCLSIVRPGDYCAGAGCLIGSKHQALGNITLRNVSISSRDRKAAGIGWLCDDASSVTATGVAPAVCKTTAPFICSET